MQSKEGQAIAFSIRACLQTNLAHPVTELNTHQSCQVKYLLNEHTAKQVIVELSGLSEFYPPFLHLIQPT